MADQAHIAYVHVLGGAVFEIDLRWDTEVGVLDLHIVDGDDPPTPGDVLDAIKKAIQAGNALTTVVYVGGRRRVLIEPKTLVAISTIEP